MVMEEGEKKPGYQVIGLGDGWEFRSPAGRWETVLRVDHDSDVFCSRIWTDHTGTYGWYLPSSREIHAIPPRKVARQDLVIRLVDRGPSAGDLARMSLIITGLAANFPWAEWEDLPVAAQHLGRGLGWKLLHRPCGVEDLVQEYYDQKFGAKRRMNDLSRLFAHELDVPIGPEIGRG